MGGQLRGVAHDPAQVYEPKVLTLDSAIRYATENNLGFQTNFSNLEIATRQATAQRVGIFEPSLQFGYNRQAANSPAQGPIHIKPSPQQGRRGGCRF